ncbi:biotin--[acetyl-CoA-carboxylase] ligase [Actinoalloteichus hymeniacidonis]|uniref:biotin--[biotin carboxyl-carrier protein] ligase n=1 Tax=Actinoalloteichus hymeniacidonis TaxID=340345 RepID=A0AAC9HUS4_9PSEU|nr:biotin--[acetyl-CoA-carboxylase] ligase [Actinoalloteichus hymeniacidonis]AOS65501.1 birA, biotin-(acetyl-CoA-carboxylase) ligase [Actinoalloteichus hymeniacidonis]MBB5906412.1 BirA family biotin operon repressor/biotin-[acetyl-CoA-carboxylase] ligase [Actinoalloteichus hymeniacidonis]
MAETSQRAPLDQRFLRSALVRPAGPYAAVDVRASTGSTNADLVARAVEGAPDRTVLLAEEQTAARGRQRRSWTSPAGAGLYLSVLLRPEVPPAQLGWLPLLAGLALVRAVRAVSGVEAAMKWPNDLLVGPHQRKCAGILAEAVHLGQAADAGQPGQAIVLGIGLNVDHRLDELPPRPHGPEATSLHLEGAISLDRTELAIRLLEELDGTERTWRSHDGDVARSGQLAAYQDASATLGRRIRVELAGDRAVLGTAVDVDAGGRIVVDTDAGPTESFSAGDVVHLRAG